jgi:hypothetical protein
MGADLFIEKTHRQLIERYQPLLFAAALKRKEAPEGSPEAKAAQTEVDKYRDLIFSTGYFRDNYNVTCVLWRLDLSWWDDVIPLCDDAGLLNGDPLLRFRHMVGAAELSLPTRKELKEGKVELTKYGECSLAGWHDFYRRKHRELLAFLDEAIASDSAIRCDL